MNMHVSYKDLKILLNSNYNVTMVMQPVTCDLAELPVDVSWHLRS